MSGRAYSYLLGKRHYRELEIGVERQFRKVYIAHLVCLIDVKKNVVAVLEIGEHATLSGLEIHSLSHVAAVVTDAEIAVLGRLEINLGSWFGSDTTAEDVACVFEVAGLIVAVTHTPSLFDESRQGCEAEAVQGVIIQVVVAGIVDVLMLAII